MSSEAPAPETTLHERKTARLGMVLFLAYLALYAGFIYLAAFRPTAMAWRPFGGVNLAIWYGMALIVSPLALAAVYLAAGRKRG